MKNIDDFFKEELGSYAELPPPPAWGALEKRLDEEKKRRLFPFRWLWVVGLFAILGFTGYSVAWKMSATRDLTTGSVLPTGQKSPAASTPGNTTTTTINNQPHVEGANSTGMARPTAASTPGNTNTATINNQPEVEGSNSTGVTTTTTSNKTGHIASTSTKRKHTVHQLALASSRNKKISKHKKEVLRHITEEKEYAPVATKTERPSQYPDEDYYEGATASIAPTPVETSTPSGYTVNKRKKNNMLVADMSPKEEPVTHHYAAVSVETEPSNSEPTVTTTAQASATRSVSKHPTTSRGIAHQSKPATKAGVTNKQPQADDNSIAVTGSAKATSSNLSTHPKHNNTTTVAKVDKPAIAATTPVAASVSERTTENKAPKPVASTSIASKSIKAAAVSTNNKKSAKTTPTNTIVPAPKDDAKIATKDITPKPATFKSSGAIAATNDEKKPIETPATSASARITGTEKIVIAKKHKADAPSVATTAAAATTAVATTTPKVAKAKHTATTVPSPPGAIPATTPDAAPASTSVLASSAPVKKHTKTKISSEPAAGSPIATTSKKATAPKTAEAPAAKETTPSAAAASTTAPAKPAKVTVAMKSASKKATAAASEETARAENSADTLPGSETTAATAPKAKHSKKARKATAGEDNLLTSVAAIAGTQPAKKATKHTGKTSSLVAAKPAPATDEKSSAIDETGTPEQDISTAPAKVAKTTPAKPQSKTAGKAAQPATNTFASAAKGARSQPVTKTSNPVKAAGGNLARFNDEEVPTEDPTINTSANNTLAAAKKEEPVPGTFKEKTPPAPDQPLVKKEESKPQVDSPAIAAKNRKFEYGIKGGVEGSYDGNASRKIVISPYLDYKLNDKFSLMVQPAFKAASLNTRNLGGAQTYYSIDNTDSILTRENYNVKFNPWGGTDTVGVTRTYQYSQTHRAVTKGYSIGGSYYEFELPMLFKYAVTPKLAMYAGININYSRAIRINEHTYASAPITTNDTISQFTAAGQSEAAPPSVNSVMPISGNPISSYTGPLYATPSTDLLRFGYMAGFSYEFHKNWMVDALVQQGFTKSNVQGGYDVNKPLTLPYIRLTLGYRLSR